MEIKIEEQKQNLFLERDEIKGIIRNEKTISKSELQKAVSEKINKPSELIAVKTIYPAFGSHEAQFQVFVYNSAEALKRIEPKPKIKTEKKPKEATPTSTIKTEAKPAAKPEAKVEEKKEEKKEKPKQEKKA